MKVQAIRTFNDIEAGVRRNRGDVFDAADERGAYLASLGLAKQLQEPAEQAQEPAEQAQEPAEQAQEPAEQAAPRKRVAAKQKE